MPGRLGRRMSTTMKDRHVHGTLDRLQSHSQFKATRHPQDSTNHGNCSVGEGKSSKGGYYAKGNRR